MNARSFFSELKTRNAPTVAAFEEAWNRYLPSSSENAATVATSATHDRGNVAAVADVAASAYIGDEDDGGLDL